MLSCEQATIAWAKAFSSYLTSPCQIHLYGNLGAGKTTLVRGVLQGLGYFGVVRSPTYTLIEPYETQVGTVFHLDLYRLGDAEELEYLGIRDIAAENPICLIEWPERGQGFLPAVDLQVTLQPEDDQRRLTLNPVSNNGLRLYENVIKSKANKWQ